MPAFSTLLLCASALLSFSFVPFTQAKNVTIVVDDAAADPLTGRRIQYLPANAWKAGKNDNCDNCTAHLNASVVYQSTWHEAEDAPGAANETRAVFSFEGTSVSVHCLIASVIPQSDEDLSYDLVFSLDGKANAGFTTGKAPQGAARYNNVAVFESEPLQMGNHTLEIWPAAAIDPSGDYSHNRSTILLDYIEYS
ncbi:hypothetical protein GY45DRAFT_1316378 [Cubamyces sp. BRFM 1775]|nr:hypothetical protein GY45DRAFT_1316378 [Cubamyces sp. BRFM 1775]